MKAENGWFDFLHLIKLTERTTSLFHVYTVPVNAPHLNKNIIILVFMIYEINCIWTAEMKWKWRKWSSQWTQFMQLRKEAWKKFRTSTGFEPVTSRYRCDALPTELWSHWYWEQVNCRFICSRERISFSGYFTQLHKLRSLRRSFLHFHNNFNYNNSHI